MHRSACVEIEVEGVEAETQAALLCRVDGASYWIPKSQVHDDSEVYKDGDEGTMIVSTWIAEKLGLV